MGKRKLNEDGEEEISFKKKPKTHKKSKHKHIYKKALLRTCEVSRFSKKPWEYYHVGKYCTICGRAVDTTYGSSWIQKEDGFLRRATPSDYPDLPVVDVQGRAPVFHTVLDPKDI